MPVLIDTNVLSDVIHDDPIWRNWAEDQLEAFVGELVINPIIYAELCCRARTAGELDQMLAAIRVGYREIPKAALFPAAQAFLSYRQRGGTKTAPLPDFFIGAHAGAEGWRLVTRDPTRYRSLFSQCASHLPVTKHTEARLEDAINDHLTTQGHGRGGAGEQSPLQARAAFFKSRSWGLSSATNEDARARWSSDLSSIKRFGP